MQDQAMAMQYLKDRYEKRPRDLKAIPLGSGIDYVPLCTHSDIVKRVWFDLADALPGNCRDIVSGNPVLRHPRTGLMFVVGLSISTYYVLRIPRHILEDVRFEERDFVRSFSVRTGKRQTLDLREVFGQHWVFGGFRKSEIEWCRAAYEEASQESA